MSGAAALWHDVECGAYVADLALWEELADSRGGPVLELGCGTGRVALHLARRGHRVLGLDSDERLVEVLRERGAGLGVEAELGDARDFNVGTRFPLVIAPMQLLQLLPGREDRIRCLRRVHEHLRPAGAVAVAIVKSVPVDSGSSPPLPDTRESDGWVYSSLPLDVGVEPGAIRIRRLRQAVSPAGALSEETNEVRLARLDAAALEAEADEAGFAPCERREIPPTDAHVGSTVLLLERGA
jgi:SAM-dependent methyltransferase